MNFKLRDKVRIKTFEEYQEFLQSEEYEKKIKYSDSNPDESIQNNFEYDVDYITAYNLWGKSGLKIVDSSGYKYNFIIANKNNENDIIATLNYYFLVKDDFSIKINKLLNV